jgi:hypothetical protein
MSVFGISQCCAQHVLLASQTYGVMASSGDIALHRTMVIMCVWFCWLVSESSVCLLFTSSVLIVVVVLHVYSCCTSCTHIFHPKRTGSTSCTCTCHIYRFRPLLLYTVVYSYTCSKNICLLIRAAPTQAIPNTNSTKHAHTP